MGFYDSCDESKCVSKGNSESFGGSFTCYGDDDGLFQPRMCSDGFLPIIVEDEPPIYGIENGVPLRYFTCCPPVLPRSSLISSIGATRQCSDPVRVGADDSTNPDIACDNQDTHKQPKKMNPATIKSFNPIGTLRAVETIDFFLCCDDSLSTTVDEDAGNATAILHTNDLDEEEVECVPYRNDLYEPATVQNRIGAIEEVSCNLEGFSVPRLIDDDGGSSSPQRYQCCANGTAMPPFVQDSIFASNTYPIIALNCIAALASGIVVVALLIPLFLQLKDGSYQREQHRTGRQQSSSLQAPSSLWRSSHTSAPQTTPPRPPSTLPRDKAPSFSTYNLYLVYLALPDLLYALYVIATHGSLANQKFHRKFFNLVALPSEVESHLYAPDLMVVMTYKFLNMAINTIVSHQVLVLLRTSRRAQKIHQPSLKTVSLQAGGVYAGSLLWFLAYYFGQNIARKAEANGDFERSENLMIALIVVAFLVAFGMIGYVAYASTLVWWRGYIPSPKRITARDRAMRALFFFFFRIVAIFLGVWIPCLMMVMFAIGSGETWPYVLGTTSGAIQAILTACVILTKSDVRKHVLDLVTLSYLFGKPTSESSSHVLPVVESDSEVSIHSSKTLFFTKEKSTDSTSSPARSQDLTLSVDTAFGSSRSIAWSGVEKASGSSGEL